MIATTLHRAVKTTLGVVLLGTMLMSGPYVLAQEIPEWAAPVTEPPPPPQRPDLPIDPPPVPVDGGLFGLALVGAGYAVRRLRRQSG